MGEPIKQLRERLPGGVDLRVAAIFRAGQPIIPEPETRIAADDEVFFLADRGDIRTIMDTLRPRTKPVRRVFIAGGGNIGVSLAGALEGQSAAPAGG